MSDDKNLDKVLVRIKQLLAMAADQSSEHEAAIAAGRAKKLMDQYNVSMADVIEKELKEFDSSLINENINEWSFISWPQWMISLSINCGNLFDCRIRYSRAKDDARFKHLRVYGYKSDVEVCRYVFTFLFDTVRKMADSKWLEVRHDVPSTISAQKWKKSYSLGIVDGIQTRLNELYKKPDIITSAGTSLMVVKIDQLEKKYGKFDYTNVDVDNYGRAYKHGVTDSDKIELNKGVGSPDDVDQLN